ncbi:MAG TPA: hypothetical protein VNA19_00395 [Pyrinomonadaceae bacterium]|nr:hypothetical protein [Pyrinomonadaceae bacterium]
MFSQMRATYREGAGMQFQGAVMKEQGIIFAIITVKEQVIDNGFEAETTRRGFQTVFPGLPIVLMARDSSSGRAIYNGRDDIVGLLTHMPVNAIPLRQYTVN